MSKRNAHALAARERKAGPHGGSSRPTSFEDDWGNDFDECPDCEGTGIDTENEEDGCCNTCEGLGVGYD